MYLDLIPIFKSFSKDEIKRFRVFLKSPYFNKNKSLVKFYELIIHYYPTFKTKKLNKENLYAKLFENEPYNDSTIRSLTFRMENLLNKFLLVESVERKAMLSGNLLLNEFNHRKQKHPFKKQLEYIESLMNKSPGANNEYYYNKYLLEINKYNFSKLNDLKPRREVIRYRVKRIEKGTLYLFIYYITELICNYLNQSVILNKYNLKGVRNFITELLKNINLKKIKEHIKGRDENDFILELYYNLLECFLNFDKSDYYYNYKKFFNKNEKKMGKDEISFHYSRLISYCIYKNNAGKSSVNLKKELLCLYKDFLKKELYKDNKVDYLPHNLFREILLHALSAGELGWVKYFIDEYSKKVEYRLRDSMYSYGNAFYYYYAGEPEQSEKYLPEIMKRDFYFRFDAKHLNIAINYDRNNLSAVTETIHAYRVSLSEIEIMPDEIKKKHNNYLRCIKKLVSFKYGREDKQDIEYLKTGILKTDDIIHREWLVSKCDALLQRKIKKYEFKMIN